MLGCSDRVGLRSDIRFRAPHHESTDNDAAVERLTTAAATPWCRRPRLRASRKPDDRLRLGLGRAGAATAACWRVASTGTARAAGARRRPSVTRRSVLDHARVGADRVASQVLLAGVAVVLAVFERRIVHS